MFAGVVAGILYLQYIDFGPQEGNGAIPTLSHDNGRNGIVWTLGSDGLKAYDASSQGIIKPIYNDNPGNFIDSQSVVVANGLVFVAGDNFLSVYGAK